MIKLQTVFQRATSDCKEIIIPPIRDISGQVTIFLLGGTGNSDRTIINNNNVLSSVIRQEQQSALKKRSVIALSSTVKERSFTAYKERSWFEPSISRFVA